MPSKISVPAQSAHFDPDFTFMFGAKGAWQFYSHASVKAILLNYEQFGNAYLPTGDSYTIGSNLNQTDPPLHGSLRSLISDFFSVKTIQHYQLGIREYCLRLVNNAVTAGHAEVVNEVANPLAAAVICDIMGIPALAHSQVNAWGMAIVNAGFVENGHQKASIAQQEMAAFFVSLMEERQRHPKADLLTRLAGANTDGQQWQMTQKAANCMTILLAGHETTSTLLSNLMEMLALNPDLQQWLKFRPDYFAGTVWEVLRLRPSLQSMYRIARQDTLLEGIAIKKDALVNAWITTANRDPAIFQNPDVFIPERKHHEVLSFGYGIHHCIGEVLAQTQARILLECLLFSSSSFRLHPELLRQTKNNPLVSGFMSLPILFTKP